MSLPNPWSSYRQVAIQTATPGQLVLMLFDGAIRFLERARLGFTETDPLAFNTEVNNNIQRAQAIIRELNNSLNLRDAGEVAAHLQRLYDYMDDRLQESNFQKSEAGVSDVLRRLGILREAWAEMLRRREAEAEPSVPALAFAGQA